MDRRFQFRLMSLCAVVFATALLLGLLRSVAKGMPSYQRNELVCALIGYLAVLGFVIGIAVGGLHKIGPATVLSGGVIGILLGIGAAAVVWAVISAMQ